ncbi:cytochrome P450 oxidoreductase [Metarhizium anisopliae]|nr:cytochrome P450 oxidoreductase [Metarhizium anisopliae]
MATRFIHYVCLDGGSVESKAAAAVLGTSKTTNEIMARDPGRTQNHFASFRKTVRPVLAPGSATLEAMFKRSFHTMSLSLDEKLTPGSPRSVQLLAWTGHEITMAGTYGEYGGANPFQDPFVEQAWLKFVAGLPVLVCGFFPSIFARQRVQAREFLAQRFLCYFKENHHLGGSGAVLARLRHNTESGMPLTDTARGELGACLALLNNTIPGFFWLVYHIFADHGVLQDLREELAGAVRVGADGVHTIHVARVRSCCPILQSTVQEVLRFRGIGTGMVRSVLEDQLLDSQYLLKKGSLVFAPNAVQHFAPALWGLDCNRRHFARGQLLVFAAMLVLRANIRPVRGGWSCIKAEKSFGLGIATGFLMPDKDLEVEISPIGEQTWRVDFCTNV